MNYSHEGGKEFQCDICDYNASTPQNLTQHKISGLSKFYPNFIEILSTFLEKKFNWSRFFDKIYLIQNFSQINFYTQTWARFNSDFYLDKMRTKSK